MDGTRALVAPTPSSLDDPKVKSTLERLHAAAAGDTFRMLGRLPTFLGAVLGKQPPRERDEPPLQGRVHPSRRRRRGKLLYLTARALDAKRIVEFGTSFGISTIYAPRPLRATTASAA